MATEFFTCFYTHPPFWAEAELDFGEQLQPPNFTERMEEIVFDQQKDGFHVRVARDGEIQLRRDDLEAKITKVGIAPKFEDLTNLWAEYLMLVNVFYLSLDMACLVTQNHVILDFQEVTRKDAYRTRYLDGNFVGCGVPWGSLTSHYQSGRRLMDYAPGMPVSMDVRIALRRVITTDTLLAALSHFRRFLAEKPLLEKVDALSKAVSQYRLGNISTSIVLSWFVLERCINELYEKYLASKERQVGQFQRIDSDRRKFLTGRDFTAAIKTSELELNDIISLDEFKHFNLIRGLRNDIAHDLNKKPITLRSCSFALNFAAKFLFKEIDPKLQLNTGLNATGF
jgi:hypothetical protein